MTNKAEDISTLQDAWKDFDVRRTAEEKRFSSQRPRKVGNVLAQLVSLRGYAQIRISDEQEKAWQSVVGADLATVTEFSKLRRGTMEVIVANSLLMQELTFRKEELLASLQAALPTAVIKQLRFKVGKNAGYQGGSADLKGITKNHK